jgi:tetratricopeptide (TPR) repeat protein
VEGFRWGFRAPLKGVCDLLARPLVVGGMVWRRWNMGVQRFVGDVRMPRKPREQWIPNPKLQAARERLYGRKSRSRFANAVRRRCEQRFGAGCGVDHRRVRRWEEGECRPDVYHQEVICELAGVAWEERDQLGFGESPSDGALVLADPAVQGGAGIVVVDGQGGVCEGLVVPAGLVGNGAFPQEGSAADRRAFMGLVNAFACTPVPLDALERFAVWCVRPWPIDEALVRDVERVTAAVGAAYDTTAPRQLLVPARLLMKRTTRLLAGSMLPAQRQRLLCCASEAALVVGWLYFNLDEPVDARSYFLLAQDLAGEALDEVVHARALGALSNLYSITYPGGYGDTAKALELAQRANAMLPEHAPAGVCSWLAIREGVEHAAFDDASGYGRLIERAEVAGSAVQSEFGGFGGWDEGFVNGFKGVCLWLLNQPAAAEQAFQAALTCSSLARVRGRNASYLVGVYAAQDDPEAACSTGRQALECSVSIGYVSGLQRLLVVRKTFREQWAELSYVQEFDELLRAAMVTLRGDDEV